MGSLVAQELQSHKKHQPPPKAKLMPQRTGKGLRSWDVGALCLGGPAALGFLVMISCRKGRFRRVRVGGIGFTPTKKHKRGLFIPNPD